MNSLHKFKQLFLVLGVALLLGASALGLKRLSELKERERAGLEERELGPDQPDEAARFRRLQMQDENGFIPPDGLEKARQQVVLMKAAQQQRRKARQGAPKTPQEIEAAGIAPDSWTWLGPGNIGGRIRSIVIHPTNTNTMWVGSVGGGIWRTDNGGTAWFPVNDFLANLAVSTMVINPANPNVMYAGTGEGFNNIDQLQGAGIFKSTDGGATWNQLASTNNANWFYVNRLAISPNGNTILAATNSGIWQSTDSGATWSQRTTSQAVDIHFLANDSNRAIVGEIGSARFSLDGGQTWTAATFAPAITVTSTNNGRVELANALFTSLVYAAVNQNNGEVYRSNDGGQSYTRVNTGTNFFLGGAGNQGWYDNTIWLNPLDPDTVVVGGINLWRGRYTQPTLALTPISNGGANSAHSDHHVIIAHPGFNNTTNRIVFFGNDGGIYRTDDVSTVAQASGWVKLNNNLGITQFYGAAGNANSGVIVGGAQDNGTVRLAGGAGTGSWTTMFGNDGGYCASDPTDPNFFYGESQFMVIVRSNNGGVNAGNISSGIGDANNGTTTNFIAPFILDPNNADTMLAGGLSLWRSTDVKTATTPTWTPFPAPPGGNSLISAIAVSPVNSAFICVGHNNGDIFLTFNGTSSSPIWTKVDPPAPALPDRFVTRLVIDSTRSPTWVYATFGGFSSDNVYRTTDFGTTWTDVTGAGATGLPDVPVRSLVIHPRNSNFLYVGTEVGIFSSEDAGVSWSLTQDGPANVSVDELFWMGADLIAATHGRGIYRASGGLYVDCNYNGAQVGTFDQPFKTVTAAVNAAATYRTIWIKPCNYNETFPALSKRVELRNLGGTVNIGKP